MSSVGTLGGIAGILTALGALGTVFVRFFTGRHEIDVTAEDREAERLRLERVDIAAEYRRLNEEIRTTADRDRARFEQQMSSMGATLQNVRVALGQAQQAHQECTANLAHVTERLSVAEAKIAELGG